MAKAPPVIHGRAGARARERSEKRARGRNLGDTAATTDVRLARLLRVRLALTAFPPRPPPPPFPALSLPSYALPRPLFLAPAASAPTRASLPRPRPSRQRPGMRARAGARRAQRPSPSVPRAAAAWARRARSRQDAAAQPIDVSHVPFLPCESSRPALRAPCARLQNPRRSGAAVRLPAGARRLPSRRALHPPPPRELVPRASASPLRSGEHLASSRRREAGGSSVRRRRSERRKPSAPPDSARRARKAVRALDPRCLPTLAAWLGGTRTCW